MKIAAFVQLRRTITPTGVGVHIIQMARRLAKHPDIDLQLLVSRKEMDPSDPRGRRIDPIYPLHDMPACAYPLSRAWMERVWRVLGMPAADRYCPGMDWIYSPAEAYVPARRAKLAVTIHDMYPMEPNLPWSEEAEQRAKGRRWNAMCQAIFRRADLLLAVSQFTKQRIVELGHVNPQRIVVTGNGVGEEYFRVAEAGPRIREGRYVLVVGGLTRRKRGDRVLDVAARLQQRDPELAVVVAGKCRERYVQQARELANVHLLGYVPDEQLPLLMRDAEALLFLSQYEGFGMPALEAMAAGTVVITSHHAALPEIVGDAGVVVDPDPRGAADTVVDELVALRDDPARSKALRERGRRRAAQFTWDHIAARLIAALRERQ